MALADIVAPTGDGQDFVMEMPAGNAGYVPQDFLVENGVALLCVEVPVASVGGGNIFVISD